MGYFCLKPCRLSGTDYKAGDPIPTEAVVPESVKALMEMGFIAETTDDLSEFAPGAAEVIIEGIEGPQEKVYISLLSKTDEQDVAVPVPVVDIQAIFCALQLNADEAAAYVKDGIIESPEALEVLAKIDQRKTVKAAIKLKTEESGVN